MIQPLRDLVYIIPIQPQEKGLIITSLAHEHRPHQGIVKYRGPKTTGEVLVGDHVFFHGWEGLVIVFEDEGSLVVLKEDQVYAKYKEGGEIVMSRSTYSKHLRHAVVRLCVKNENYRGLAGEITKRIEEELDGLIAQELYF